jgi:hypothetical protein
MKTATRSSIKVKSNFGLVAQLGKELPKAQHKP